MKKLRVKERERLLKSARAAARNSYSPYSHFRVGAAILNDKTVHIGTNVENASYGLTLCAERTALASFIAQGGKPKTIRAIAVACIDARKASPNELMPCGACRQWMKELAPDAEIIVDGVEGTFTVDDLLPLGFTLQNPKAGGR